MTIAAADGPAPGAHHRTRPGRPTSVTVTASSGGSVPRSPAAAASCCSRHSPPASHRLRRLLPDPGHRACTPRRTTSTTRRISPQNRRDHRFQPGLELDRRRHLRPPRPERHAGQPGVHQAPRTRRTRLPATNLTRRRRQQPRLRPHRLAPPQLARPIRAAQGCAATHGGILRIPNWMAAWRYQGTTEWPGCLPRWAFPASFVPHRME